MAGLLLAGNVRFARKNESGYEDYLDLGNTKKFAIKSEAETKTRVSTDPDSYGEALDSVNIPKPTGISISTDEFSVDVMAMLFRGGISNIAIAAGTAVVETFAASLGRYRRLGKGNLQAGVAVKHNAGATATTWAVATAKAAGDYVVPATPNGHYYRCTEAGTTAAGEPTWPTEGATVTDGTVTWVDKGSIALAATEFAMDYRVGMVMPKEGCTVADGEMLQVTYDHAATGGKKVAAGTQLPAVGKLLFSGVSLTDQEKLRVEVPEIVLTPNGEMDLASDNFSVMSLEGSPKKLPGEEASYYLYKE